MNDTDTDYSPTMWNLFLYVQPKFLMAEPTSLSTCTANDCYYGTEQHLQSTKSTNESVCDYCLTKNASLMLQP
jgi:hypothetical protein